MSLTFVPNQQRGKIPPNHATIQKMLDENTQFIQTIVDYQNKGKVHEVSHFTQLLHRNLVYLATVADSTQNINNILPPNQQSGVVPIQMPGNNIPQQSNQNMTSNNMPVAPIIRPTNGQDTVQQSTNVPNIVQNVPGINRDSPNLHPNGSQMNNATTSNIYQDNHIQNYNNQAVSSPNNLAVPSPGPNQVGTAQDVNRQSSPSNCPPVLSSTAPVDAVLNPPMSKTPQPQDVKSNPYMGTQMVSGQMPQMNQSIRGQSMGHMNQPMHIYNTMGAQNHQMYQQWHSPGNYQGMQQGMQQQMQPQQPMYASNPQQPAPQHTNVSQSAPLSTPRHMMASAPMSQRSPNNMQGSHYVGTPQGFNTAGPGYPSQAYIGPPNAGGNTYHASAQSGQTPVPSQSSQYQQFQQVDSNFQQNLRPSGPAMPSTGPNPMNQQGPRPGHYQNYNPGQF